LTITLVQSPYADPFCATDPVTRRSASPARHLANKAASEWRVSEMIKQVVFLKKRPDMTMNEFMDYYENQHSQMARRIGKPVMPAAQRYVRRYISPEKNPVTGEVIHPGYDCIMEIWWNNRDDFEASMKRISDPERLPYTIEDEKKLFATHSNPVCTVEEFESPVGPNNLIPRCVPTFES
jgi:hypothetical protein